MTIQQMLLGTGKTSLPPMALTDTEYYSATGTESTIPYTSYATSDNVKYTQYLTPLLTQNIGTNNVVAKWGSIPNIGSTETSGARLVVIVAHIRYAGGPTNRYTNDDTNLFEGSGNSVSLSRAVASLDVVVSGPNGTGRVKLQLKGGSNAYTDFTFGGMYAASTYNTTSVWYKMLDLEAESSYTCNLTDGIYSDGSDKAFGNVAIGAIVIDNVSNIVYTQSQSTGNSDTTINQTSNLNLAAQTGTSATKILRIVAANGSNISDNVLDYNKGSFEPSYTLLGENDNGTDERNYTGYHFGDHSGFGINNMTGDFGDGSTNASDGIAGMGIMFGLN